MFEVIHEFAVLGTTCFMMALATVWYSPMMFGAVWMREARLTDEMVEKAKSDMWKHMVLTFISYTIMLGLLALMVVYAPVLALTPMQASGLLALFVAAVAVPTTLFEGRSLTYYGIQVGFWILFIIIGTYILQYWPW